MKDEQIHLVEVEIIELWNTYLLEKKQLFIHHI